MKIHACILAMALGAVACGGGARGDHDDNSTAASPGKSGEGKPVTLAGCLQKGDGSDYILTQASMPSDSVGTSGTSSGSASDPNKPSSVGEEQLGAAARSYRLSGADDQMRDLVGHQVRVQGKIADTSDLSHDKAGTADKPADIDEGDLAKVEVATVESTAASCGAAPNK